MFEFIKRLNILSPKTQNQSETKQDEAPAQQQFTPSPTPVLPDTRFCGHNTLITASSVPL